MTRLLLACVLLAGCGGADAPAEAPKAAGTGWITGIKPWYCGTEALPAKVTGGASVPQQRDVAMKIVPGKESFTAIYASMNGTDKSVGSLTRFTATGDRAATLRWENDQRQNGDLLMAFAPDYSTVTLTWQPKKTPPGSSPVPPAATTLTAAAGPSACAAGTLIR